MYLKEENLDNLNKEACSGLVVKTNRLVMAIQRLTVTETRLIQMAIVGARENGGLKINEPLYVSAESYSKTFNTSAPSAYEALKEAEERLFNRRFRFLEDGNEVKSQWVTRVKYLDGEFALEITLSPDVVKEITQIDGYEQFFTSYRLEKTSGLKSIYSIRLYELLVQWAKAQKTPIFKLDIFRAQMGLEAGEYKTMSNFKKFVLESSIKEINEKTDLKIDYEQYKKGRKIVGFSFTIKPKNPNKFKRQKISIAEALELSQTVVKGGYAGESEKEAIGRVMNHKDENGNSVYFINASKEDWQAHRNNKKQLTNKIEKKSQEQKWQTIGNTLVDDIYITKHKHQDETYQQAKKRIEKELSLQLELELNRVQEDDRPLWEVLGEKI
ncbi:MAG TPA: replication initiation protein RepM [Candidatus Dorea intestinavium]|nr:replication initiation protein RepM [Candidatus Dorea intestinavium]